MDYTNQTAALIIPLVGTLPHEVHRAEETNDVDVNVNADVSHPTEEPRGCCCNDTSMHVALYLLLLLQFGLAFYADYDGAVAAGLNWTLVNLSIVLFMVAAHLYRNVLDEIEVCHDVVVLVPEVIVVATMGLVYGHQMLPGFLLLVAGKLLMALTVVFVNSYRLWYADSLEAPPSTELATSAGGISIV